MSEELKIEHVREVLLQDILIGADSRSNKRFCFNPWLNEYRVYVNKVLVYSGMMGEMLEKYNDIQGF